MIGAEQARSRYRESLSGVRGRVPPTGSLAVVLAAENVGGGGQALRPQGRQGSWGTRRQAEGCVVQSSRALATAARCPRPGLDLMVVAVSTGRGPWRPQQLEDMDTAIQVRASPSFSLSIRVSKIGTAWVSCRPLAGGQRSGVSCQDFAHHYFTSPSVVGTVLNEGQLL